MGPSTAKSHARHAQDEKAASLLRTWSGGNYPCVLYSSRRGSLLLAGCGETRRGA